LCSQFLFTLFILRCRPPALMQCFLARFAMLEARAECPCVCYSVSVGVCTTCTNEKSCG